MAKKMTLDEAWDKCLKMWRWVVKQTKEDDTLVVRELKRDWLKVNDPDASLADDCYFCEYADQCDDACSSCPGVLADKFFDCGASGCEWDIEPLAFLAKLEELNRKRLAKKAKKVEVGK